MAAELAIVILNYRTPDLTVGCLSALAAEIRPGIDVVVVDNASGDGSAERIESVVAERGWSSWASVLRSLDNGGFAAGNNAGIKSVEAKAYLLLNSDTIVRPGAVQSLCEAMRLHPEVGVVGAGLVNGRGDPDYSFFRELRPFSEFLRAANTEPLNRLLKRFHPRLPHTDRPFEPAWVGFACVLIRAEVFRTVGLLDEKYFMYFEDVDFCRRASRAGWKTLYWPDAKVVHLHGGSSGVTEVAAWRGRAPRYYYESRARYFAKFYGRQGLWLANCFWYAGRSLSLGREAFGRPAAHREREAMDIWIGALDPLRPDTGRAP